MRKILASAAGTLSLLLSATLLPAQEPAKSSGTILQLTTSSAEARAAFMAGVDAAENVLFAAAAEQMKQALELDPKLGVARAFYATYAPGLTATQRQQELQQAATDAMNASVGELLLVLSMRAPAGAERRSLLKAAAEAAPDDPHVLYLLAAHTPTSRERVRSFEEINRRFPDFAPAYNLLAYVKARDLQDLEGGLAAVQRYLGLLPKNPNAHDSYAELLAWAGQLDQAAEHYQHALALDPTYSAAHTGLAEVAILRGRSAEARTHYQHALPIAPTAQAKLNLRQSAAIAALVDGNARVTLSELREIADEAETNGYTGVAAQAHRNIAVVEAALGNSAVVDTHVRKAEALGGGNDNTQHAFAAAAYAIAGDVAGARPHAEAFAAASTSGSLTFQRQAQAITAIVEAAAGNLDAAQAATSKAGVFDAFGKVLMAEALKSRGKKQEARALAAEVLTNTQTDLISILARQRARKI